MSITGIPTDNGDNTVTVTGTGTYSVDGQGGTDTLVVNYSSSTNDIDYQSAGGGWYQFTDH